jgi:hypothetical protein
MRFLRAAVSEVLGLFVADWTQTLTSVVILAVGWLALPRFKLAGVAFAVALALAVQLVVATLVEARRKAGGRASH